MWAVWTTTCLTWVLTAVMCLIRIFQERVVGSQVLSQYQQADEARARVQLMGEERRQDRPNLLMGTYPPVGTWRVRDAVMRRNNTTRRLGF